MTNSKLFYKSVNAICAEMDLKLLIPDSLAREMVMEFAGTHGTDAVIALFGYITYAKMTGQEDHIIGCIEHDLSGRNEPTMLPLSSSYLEYAVY